MNQKLKIAVIGGGAAGFFGALRAAEVAQAKEIPAEIIIFENSPQVLKKVRISGGGRCNVTHHCYDPQLLIKNYPRGFRELIAPFQRFQPKDTLEWFALRGVKIIPEEDGRMFPDTNSSETIIQCFMHEVQKYGIEVKTQHIVQNINKLNSEEFQIQIKDREEFLCHKVLLATGSSPAGYELARGLGHTITQLAPSLFSFKIEDPLLVDLSGLSFPQTKLLLKIGNQKFKQDGPTLITHWGLSGPAILKLSAWAAREMMAADYQAELIINWTGADKIENVIRELQDMKQTQTKMQIKNTPFHFIPKRFWQNLLQQAQVPEEKIWADISKKEIQNIGQSLFSTSLKILGKNRFKDEFVECGGVSLKEIHFKTMESKITPNLYFAGELMDIDGITGGFNFQNAWTSSWIAGEDMVVKLPDNSRSQ